MSANDDRGKLTGSQKGIAFFGTVTASVTHELNNVISIIEQTAGLLDDLVAGEERGVPISIERLGEISTSVQKQTRRGLGIIERLNRFAHTTDRPVTEFDVDEVVSNLVELSRRLAGLKRVTLEYRAPATEVRLTGNPFALQEAVFLTLRRALETTGGTCVVAVAPDEESGAAITIEPDGAADPDAADWGAVEEAARRAGGEIEIGSDEKRGRVIVRFPARFGNG